MSCPLGRPDVEGLEAEATAELQADFEDVLGSKKRYSGGSDRGRGFIGWGRDLSGRASASRRVGAVIAGVALQDECGGATQAGEFGIHGGHEAGRRAGQ